MMRDKVRDQMMPVPRKIERNPARQRSFPWVVVLVLAFVWIDSPYMAQAQQECGTTHKGAAKGLRVSIDTQWVSGNGYRPFRITVTPTRPVTADRTLTFKVQQMRDWSQNSDDRVIQDVTIPAGSGVVQTTLSIPPGYSRFQISVWENDKLLPTLSFSEYDNVNADGQLRILCVDFSPNTLVPLNKAVEGSVHYGNQISAICTQPSADLPTRWIDYTSVDLIWLHIDQLIALAANQPDTYEAIVSWASAGGTLCVYGLGSDWQRLVELEKLLEWPQDIKPSDTPTERGWVEPNRKAFGRETRVIEYQHQYHGGYTEEVASGPPETETPPTVPDDAPFLLRPFNTGMVVALASENPFPEHSQTWSWLLNSLTPERWCWTARHGQSHFQENTEFYNFLIPGVGLVPTTAFCVLITLFVLVIGPVNYILLRRWKRLHLLLVTIPVGAAAVAMALFLYALITDGLSTRIRVRSITSIDQQSGRTSCWSRLSYYAGLASSGLTFSEDVAIYPLEFRPFEERSRRFMIWQDEQYLASGWLPARTFIQYQTVRSRTTQHRLDIRPDAEANAKHLDVRNRLGTRIEKLLICNDDGNFYWANDIEPDALAKVSNIKPTEISSRLRKLFADAKPKYPEGIDPQNFNSGIFGGRFSNSRDISLSTGILETSLRNGSNSGPNMTPRSYLAIVERSPEVELGTSAVSEEGSFHVIVGRW